MHGYWCTPYWGLLNTDYTYIALLFMIRCCHWTLGYTQRYLAWCILSNMSINLVGSQAYQTRQCWLHNHLTRSVFTIEGVFHCRDTPFRILFRQPRPVGADKSLAAVLFVSMYDKHCSHLRHEGQEPMSLCFPVKLKFGGHLVLISSKF